MMELKEGIYVRTKLGISKYLRKYEDSEMYLFDKLDENLWSGDIANVLYRCDIYGTIIKASYNIIDLIEIGDIITFKNDDDVYKVICVPNEECALEVFYLAKNYDGETEDIIVYKDDMRKYIDRILTKEKFKKDSYEVK